ncbi:carbohydrate kinase [Bradyrhizobium sp. Arg237L]|uniref:carbohydrate kinase family protein n=1 Tax=Bradyrhizobium sp. Arg237L TaxID=3003352 RepID=UPI00249E82BE|nr:carbohydrate kinase [Bradyrhizobium sp. Arg237L]MDI4231901.1 carbohydrate kinase [Bradyrhizobium sp. Arg237L]
MLLSCGDALIDFVPVAAADGREAVRPAVGGSCLNVAVGLARLGAPTGFVGGVSTDLFGRMIADHAVASGVDLRYATRSDRQTTLAFVRMVAGESQYAFYDAETATREWTYAQGKIPFETIEAVHIGSTTLVNQSGAVETAAMVADAKSSATISFDPNCRPNLVKDKTAYLARMDRFIDSADIVRMSDVDFDYLYGKEAYAAKAEEFLAGGGSLFVITRGMKGAQAWHPAAGAIEVGAPAVTVVDTIGAGDSFQAALLFALHKQGRLGRSGLKDTKANELRSALSFACSCAALTCTRVGADPPRSNEVAWKC